jgi:hypothetical protein
MECFILWRELTAHCNMMAGLLVKLKLSGTSGLEADSFIDSQLLLGRPTFC